MDKKEAFSKYLNDLRSLLSESFDGKFYFSGANDMDAARELFNKQIEPLQVMMILQEEEMDRPFNLSEVKRLVLKKVFSSQEAEPYCAPEERIEELRHFVSFLLSELNAPDDYGIVKKLAELASEEDLLKVESELYKIENNLFKLLKLHSPHYQECARVAAKKVKKFSFYWDKKVLSLTEKALIRECLRKKHGIPPFSSLPSP